MPAGPVIASRTYELGRRRVEVRLLAPKRTKTEWECTIEVDGVEPPIRRPVYGEDSMQALTLAVKSLRIVLANRLRDLRWFDDTGESLGLPFVIDGTEPELAVAQALWQAEVARVTALHMRLERKKKRR
jgi:hypothetical protein